MARRSHSSGMNKLKILWMIAGWSILLCSGNSETASALNTGGEDKALQKLRRLTEKATDGVIVVNERELLEETLTGPSRPYSVVLSVMLTERVLRREGVSIQKSGREIRENFKEAAKNYKKIFKSSDRIVFFMLVNYSASVQEFLSKLTVNKFPHTVIIPANHKMDLSADRFDLPHDLHLLGSKKEALDNFLKDTLDLQVLEGEQKMQFSLVTVLFFYCCIIAIGFFVWEISRRKMLIPLLAVGSLGVFWISSAGFIKCIIHSMPLLTMGNDGKPQVFMHGSRSQTVSEGFTMSTHYLIFTACVSSITYYWPYLKHEGIKKMGLYATFIIGVLSYMYIVEVFQWKNGMRVHIYGVNM